MTEDEQREIEARILARSERWLAYWCDQIGDPGASAQDISCEYKRRAAEIVELRAEVDRLRDTGARQAPWAAASNAAPHILIAELEEWQDHFSTHLVDTWTRAELVRVLGNRIDELRQDEKAEELRATARRRAALRQENER